MYTFSICMQCQKENNFPNFRSMGVQRIPDNGVIELICDRGHRTANVITNPKYEILSELAVTALCDGYYREAIASFASALERLYEHYINVVCQNRKLDSDQLKKTWKILSKLSERQLGAFTFLYLVETGEAFSPLEVKQVKFRNDVIHGGMIPDRDQAVSYGQAVGDCAAPLIALLHSPRYQEAHQRFIQDSAQERTRRAVAADTVRSTQMINTPFSFAPPAEDFDLKAILAEREKRPDMKQAANEANALAGLFEDLIRKSYAP